VGGDRAHNRYTGTRLDAFSAAASADVQLPLMLECWQWLYGAMHQPLCKEVRRLVQLLLLLLLSSRASHEGSIHNSRVYAGLFYGQGLNCVCWTVVNNVG
jgi:hypothetical protein